MFKPKACYISKSISGDMDSPQRNTILTSLKAVKVVNNAILEAICLCYPNVPVFKHNNAIYEIEYIYTDEDTIIALQKIVKPCGTVTSQRSVIVTGSWIKV